MSQADNRIHQRVQFFRLPKDKEFIPVWVFHQENDGHAGLVIDLSENGMQVLTAANEQPSRQNYDISFLDDEGSTKSLHVLRLAYVWSETGQGLQGLYARTGFSFVATDAGLVKELQDRIHHNQQGFLRCVLRPCGNTCVAVS
jgi:hypothetical protein